MKIDLPEKRYYSIGEVASKFQVKTSLIRFWEQEFKILNPKKNSRGNRKFTSKDIENSYILSSPQFIAPGQRYFVPGQLPTSKIQEFFPS